MVVPMDEQKMKPVQFIPFYLLWILSSVLSVLDWFALRAATTAVAAAIAAAVPQEKQIEMQWNLAYPVAALDKFAMVIFGIAAMVSVMSFDYLYRDAIVKGRTKRRFVTVTAIQVGLLALSLAAQAIASAVIR